MISKLIQVDRFAWWTPLAHEPWKHTCGKQAFGQALWAFLPALGKQQPQSQGGQTLGVGTAEVPPSRLWAPPGNAKC